MVWIAIAIALTVLVATLILTFRVLLPAAVCTGWAVLQERYPATPAAPGADRSTLESFTVGTLRLRAGVTVEADDTHLHLHPGRMARAAGCGPLSIPWSHITPLDPFPGGLRKAEVAGVGIIGPKWCIDLAERRR